MVRLSKEQRDTTDEILAKAFSDAPAVFLEEEALKDLARLFYYATGDARVSAFEENVLASLRRRLDEPVIALSERLWLMVEDIKRRIYFDLPGEPPSLDPDDLVEYDDPDGLPPERDETEVGLDRQWAITGVLDED